MRVTKKIVHWFVLPVAAVLSGLLITPTLAENPSQQVLPLYPSWGYQ